MTEWGVVTVLVALVGFVATVVKPIINLNTSITKLTEIVDRMSKDLDELTKRNADTHARIFERLEDHETRIKILEVTEGDDGK